MLRQRCCDGIATALLAWYASQQSTVTTPSLAPPTLPNTMSSEQRLRQPAPGSPAKQELQLYKTVAAKRLVLAQMKHSVQLVSV